MSMSKTNDTEMIEFEEVETIPKSMKAKIRNPKYDKLYEAITKAPIGFKGKIKAKGKELLNIRSALLMRRKADEEKMDFKAFILKAVTTENGKLLFFRRTTKEEFEKIMANKPKRKPKT